MGAEQREIDWLDIEALNAIPTDRRRSAGKGIAEEGLVLVETFRYPTALAMGKQRSDRIRRPPVRGFCLLSDHPGQQKINLLRRGDASL